MVERLHYFGTDPAEKKKLEDEQEALRVSDLCDMDLCKKLDAKDEMIEDKDKTLEEKVQALEAQAKLIEECKRKFDEKQPFSKLQ